MGSLVWFFRLWVFSDLAVRVFLLIILILDPSLGYTSLATDTFLTRLCYTVNCKYLKGILSLQFTINEVDVRGNKVNQIKRC